VVGVFGDRCLDTLAGTKAMKRGRDDRGAGRTDLVIAVRRLRLAAGVELSAPVVAVARKPNDETNEV
jgi:hypothetical protein